MADQELRSQAVMNIVKGEEIAGIWASPQIPDIGIYKLVAKKRIDGKYEWAHFQHRPDGTRKVLARGDVETKMRLDDVLETTNTILKRINGVAMQIAECSASTVDGKKFSGPVQ